MKTGASATLQSAMWRASIRRATLGIASFGLAASTTSVSLASAPREPREKSDARTDPKLAHTSGSDDPHLWLEQIEGEEALSWCREQNARTTSAIGDPAQSPAYKKILDITDSKEKIPHVTRIGNADGDDEPTLFNFWQDAEHIRGVWRRTSYASYKTPQPEWEEVLDIDRLNAAEGRADGEDFVWHGYELLDEGPRKAQWDRALLNLSPGGTDAVVVREFDLHSKTFVKDGFATEKAAKCSVSFRTRDEVLIGTDFEGDGGSLTDSGYPRVVKSWRRGTPLAEAKTVFEVQHADMHTAYVPAIIANDAYAYMHTRACHTLYG